MEQRLPGSVPGGFRGAAVAVAQDPAKLASQVITAGRTGRPSGAEHQMESSPGKGPPLTLTRYSAPLLITVVVRAGPVPAGAGLVFVDPLPDGTGLQVCPETKM
jgi:hypothetical protein